MSPFVILFDLSTSTISLPVKSRLSPFVIHFAGPPEYGAEPELNRSKALWWYGDVIIITSDRVLCFCSSPKEPKDGTDGRTTHKHTRGLCAVAVQTQMRRNVAFDRLSQSNYEPEMPGVVLRCCEVVVSRNSTMKGSLFP